MTHEALQTAFAKAVERCIVEGLDVSEVVGSSFPLRDKGALLYTWMASIQGPTPERKVLIECVTAHTLSTEIKRCVRE
jgi:hypothetical protein